MWSEGLREPREVHTIEDYREELVLARLATLDNTYYLYLCTAQTGAGKSTADIDVIKRLDREGKKSVTLVPDHQNCQEIVAKRREAGIESAAYPKLCEETCERYEEVCAVRDLGLSAPEVLCKKCEYREGCPYQEERKEAKVSKHKVATHARGLVALPMLSKGCSYLSIHEDSIDLFARTYTLKDWSRQGQRPNIDKEHPLLVVSRIADQAAEAATDPDSRAFYRHMSRVARYLDTEHHAAYETCEVKLPQAFHHKPEELHRDLYDAVGYALGESRPNQGGEQTRTAR
jgi:hypothetical protein